MFLIQIEDHVKAKTKHEREEEEKFKKTRWKGRQSERAVMFKRPTVLSPGRVEERSKVRV